jgi:hypothetical protein
MQNIYSGYETAPDGTYAETRAGLVRIDSKVGYWVGLKTNTRAGRNAKFIGIWGSDFDGEKFVDPARWVFDKAEALKLARFHEQIAIWDCQNGVEIYV